MHSYKKNDLYIKKSQNEIILFIHGILASHVYFEPLIKLFIEKNYSIYAVNLKGHGENYKALKNIKYHDWLNQIQQIIEKLSNKYPKVYIISHSLGTLLTLNSKNINKVTKAVLLAPALKTKVSLKSIKLALKSHSQSVTDEYLVHHQKISGIEFPSFFHKIYAIRPLIELLKLIKLTKKQLNSYKVDTIIVMSKKDESVRFSSGQYVYSHIGSKQKELIVLNKSYHSLFDKDEEKDLYNRIIEFILSKNVE